MKKWKMMIKLLKNMLVIFIQIVVIFNIDLYTAIEMPPDRPTIPIVNAILYLFLTILNK